MMHKTAGGSKKMISEKMTKLAQNNSAIRAMFEEGKKMALVVGRENVFDFSLGNPNFPAPPAVKQAIIDILSGEDSVYVHGYMSNVGYESVRATVADALNRRHGTALSQNNIIMTVGAAGALNIVLKTLLCPGDEVIVIKPYFVDYGNYVANYDGVLVPVLADETTFQPDCDKIAAAITPKTKAILVNTPNNPTGVIYTADSIKRLAAVLEAKQTEFGTSIYLVSDEPYRELAYDGVDVPYLTKFYKNTIVCYSWSKSLSLPGERIGYIVIPSECDDFQLIFDAAGIATRICGFINAPSLLQLAVARCIDEKTDITPYDENRRLLFDGLTACGYECVFPQGAFYMWMKSPGDDKEFVNAAKKHYLLVVPGTAFGCPGYVRIAYCVAKDTIARSLPAFKKLAGEYGLIK